MNAPAALLFAKILIPETEEVGRVVKVNRQEIGRTRLTHLPTVPLRVFNWHSMWLQC